MKKVLSIFLLLAVAGILNVCAKETKAQKAQLKIEKAQLKAEKEAQKARLKAEKEAIKQAGIDAKKLAKAKKENKDVFEDVEYKAIKREYFDAAGSGHTYNCWVEQQKFCKVKDLDTGLYVLCDREVSRTQYESAKIFYKLGRCTQLN